MKNRILPFIALTLAPLAAFAKEGAVLAWPDNLPVYDHVVIVMEENKDYEEVLGQSYAPYINDVLKKEGANFTLFYGQEHNSQGNYFWFFSGDNQDVGFMDQVPNEANNSNYPFTASNLGSRLIQKGLSFKGYAEGLPAIGSKVVTTGNYARKHVPWVSFANVPDGDTVKTSSNLRFEDFPPPSKYHELPTVSFVIPDLDNDMHNCWAPNCQGEGEKAIQCCVRKGDAWLKKNLDTYYQWAKKNNSLLILVFDENNDKRSYYGLTNPMIATESKFCSGSGMDPEYCNDLENRTIAIFAGAHVKPGDYAEGKGITHVNILRTIEAMYGLPRSGRQQPNAAGYGIGDDTIITDVFEKVK